MPKVIIQINADKIGSLLAQLITERVTFQVVPDAEVKAEPKVVERSFVPTELEGKPVIVLEPKKPKPRKPAFGTQVSSIVDIMLDSPTKVARGKLIKTIKDTYPDMNVKSVYTAIDRARESNAIERVIEGNAVYYQLA